ncbi:MAG: wax ester/triacylglycerol synthase family O-acyltransferase, partial [Rhodoferax sp.]|nr:wax ester/triacylglycerol synthase family O-acyltransferase [Rhodoferax sp.]
MVTRIITGKAAQPGSRGAGTAAKRVRKAARRAAGTVRDGVGAAVGAVSGAVAGERMSKVDTAWLRMDGASNLMM